MEEINSPFDKSDNNKTYQHIELRQDNQDRLWLLGIFSNSTKDLTSTPTHILIYNGKNWETPPKSWNVPDEQLYYVGKLKSGMYFLTVDGFYVFNGDKFTN